jgi:hypothetical protein
MGNLSGDLTKWTLFVIASNLTFENISTLLRTLHIQFSRRLEWNIMMGITEIMRLPHVLGSTDVVLVKLTKHRRRIDLTPCVVGESVSIRNLANGVNRGLAELPRTFRDFVGHAERGVRLLIQQTVVVTKVWTTHVPVIPLGLYV